MFKSKENIDFFSLIFTTSNDFIFDNIYHFSYKNNEIIENSSGLHETWDFFLFKIGTSLSWFWARFNAV